VSVAGKLNDTPGAEDHVTQPGGLRSVSMTAPTAAIDDWGTVVPLPVVAQAAEVHTRDLHNAVRRGQLHPAQERGKYGAALLPKDEATAVVVAAAISVAAGIVFATALKLVLAGGSFPLPGTDTATS